MVLTGRNQQTIDAAVASIGDRATGIRADVANPDDLAAVAEAVKSRGQGLDVIFANAGGGEFAALGEISVEHFTSTFMTNVGNAVHRASDAATAQSRLIDCADRFNRGL